MLSRVELGGALPPNVIIALMPMRDFVSFVCGILALHLSAKAANILTLESLELSEFLWSKLRCRRRGTE